MNDAAVAETAINQGNWQFTKERILADIGVNVPFDWRHSVGGIVALGKYLKKIRSTVKSAKDVEHLTYEFFGLASSSISKIIQISDHPILSDPQHADKLPVSWAMLYKFIALGEEGIKNVIKNYENFGTRTNVIVPLPASGNKLILSESVRSGMEFEKTAIKERGTKGASTEAAKVAGVAVFTYRQIKKMILWSEDKENISEQNRQKIKELIKISDVSRRIAKNYEKAELIASGVHKPTISEDVILNASVILSDGALRIKDMEIGEISRESVNTIILELSNAIANCKLTIKNLRRMK